MFRLRIFAGACVAFAFPTTAFADTPTVAPPAPIPTATPQLQEIGSVTTVTGDRHKEPIIRSARPTFVVTAEQIRARGYHTIAEALSQIPGMNVFRYGGIGQQANVLIAGSNKQNDVLVLINGFPVQNAYQGTVDLGAVITAGVSRIEIIEGGVCALYGSSASAGIVNVITDDDSPKPYAAISTGSFTTNRIVGADSAQIGNGTLHAAVGRETAGNAYPYPAASTYGSGSRFPSGTRINAAGQLSSGLLTYDGKLSSQWRVNGIVDSYSEHNGVPNSLPTTDFSAYQAATSLLGGVSIAHEGANATTTLSLSNTRNTLLFADSGGTYGATPVSSTNVDRTDISLRSLIGRGKSRVLLGAETSQSSVGAGLTSISLPTAPATTGVFSSSSFAARQSQNALFAQFEHDIASSGRVYAGLRYEHDSPQGQTVVPSVGATVPLGSLRVAANASSSFRVPTLLELYYPNYGTPTLLPERSRSADITLSAPQIGGGISARFFNRTASNLIQSDPSTYAASNIARASFQGFVLSGATKACHHIVLTGSFTDTYRALDTTSSNPTRLLNSPQTITTFVLERELVGNSIGWGILGNVYSSSMGFGGSAPAWSTINAYLRVPISPGAIVTLRSDNVGNEGYEANSGYPMPSRSYEVELSTR